MPMNDENREERQARVDAIFRVAKSEKQRAKDHAVRIARHGAYDAEGLTIDEVEQLCNWVLTLP